MVIARRREGNVNEEYKGALIVSVIFPNGVITQIVIGNFFLTLKYKVKDIVPWISLKYVLWYLIFHVFSENIFVLKNYGDLVINVQLFLS